MSTGGVVGFHVAGVGKHGITVSRSGTVEVRHTVREATATATEERRWPGNAMSFSGSAGSKNTVA